MSDDRPLELVETKALVDELLTRGEAVIILMCRPAGLNYDGDKEVLRKAVGSSVLCKGLLHDMIDLSQQSEMLQFLADGTKDDPT